ncbi:MAG: DUF342 domain-containing protein, partial [Caldimicrobium sp.]
MIDRKEAKEIGIAFENFTFKVSLDDNYLYLVDPLITEEEKKTFFTKLSDIKNFLSSQGITLLLEEPEYSEGKFLLAKSKPPKEGIPEKIEFLPKFSKLGFTIERENELTQREDLRERFQKIICAEKDEAIARWFPAVPPTPGINIWGDPIAPPPLKEEKIYELGENVYLDESDHHIKAKVAGVVTFDGKKLEVHPEYTIEGNVDFSTGNINFIGQKLIIQGDIKFGFTVTCKGTLELKGCTENKVNIKVEGSFISEGFLRGEETLIKVIGEAKIKGAEFAKLEIEGNLFVKDYLVFTKTYVKGNIIATEGKGVIYGGEVCAEGDIEAKILGHIAQTKSEIKGGFRKELINTYQNLIGKIQTYDEILKKITMGIELAYKLKKEGRFSSKQEEVLKKLLSEKEKIESNLKEMEEELKGLREGIKEMKLRKIKVL